MGFRNVIAKLGNMRKAADFIIYPVKAGAETVTIQSDRRIAQVNLTTGKAMLSSGKGGHYCNSFMHLNPIMGAVEIECPADVLVQLRAYVATATGLPISVFNDLINKTDTELAC